MHALRYALLATLLVLGLALQELCSLLGGAAAQETDRDQKMLAMLRNADAIVVCRWQVVQELQANRITHDEATTRFEELARKDSLDIERWLRQRFPDVENTRELYARHVLLYAEQWTENGMARPERTTLP